MTKLVHKILDYPLSAHRTGGYAIVNATDVWGGTIEDAVKEVTNLDLGSFCVELEDQVKYFWRVVPLRHQCLSLFVICFGQRGITKANEEQATA